MISRCFHAAATIVSLAVLLEGNGASATTLKALSLEQLAARAELVVRGRPVQRRCEWRGRLIYTVTSIDVTQTLKGRAPGALRVLQLGGVVGQTAMPVPGVADLGLDQEMVLFLRRDPGLDGEFVVVGMSQGKLGVGAGGELVWAPTAALWDGRVLRSPAPRRLSWDALQRALGGAR
jgi:hypothetical protein